jgi:hypothetical protein
MDHSRHEQGLLEAQELQKMGHLSRVLEAGLKL